MSLSLSESGAARARATGQLKGLHYTLASPGMERLERLGADQLAAAVVAYRDVLRSHIDVINRLNVYPVPDGDTGTNMALTLESVVEELGQHTDLEGVTRAISHGSLMGARGNSGVILSQILRGVADAFRDDPAGGGGATVVAAPSWAASRTSTRPPPGGAADAALDAALTTDRMVPSTGRVTAA